MTFERQNAKNKKGQETKGEYIGDDASTKILLENSYSRIIHAEPC
jgi:hypothetical protein